MGSFLGFAKGDVRSPVISRVAKHNRRYNDGLFLSTWCDAFVVGKYWMRTSDEFRTELQTIIYGFAGMTKPIPPLEWKTDDFGRGRQALYLGGLYVGRIFEWTGGGPHTGQWRGWFMSGPDGEETDFYLTADEARKSVEEAFQKAVFGK